MQSHEFWVLYNETFYKIMITNDDEPCFRVQLGVDFS